MQVRSIEYIFNINGGKDIGRNIGTYLHFLNQRDTN